MKKRNILALAALFLAFAVPAFAQFNMHVPDFGAGRSRLKWVKGATTDSTEVAIVVWGGAVAVTTASDTTDWLNVGRYVYQQPGFTAAPLVQLQVNHQVGAATDSIGYIIQYRSDPNATSIHQTALTHIAANTGGSTVIDAVTTSGPAAREIRLIVLNNKIASGVTRKYSVVPIIRGRLP